MARGERIQTDGLVFYSGLMDKRNLLHREKLIDVQTKIAKDMWGQDITALTEKLSPRYDHMPHVVIMNNPGGGMGKSTILLPSLEMSLSVQNDDMPVIIPASSYYTELQFELPKQSKSIVLVDEDNLMPQNEDQFAPLVDVLKDRARTVLWTIPTAGTDDRYSALRDKYTRYFATFGIDAEIYTPHPSGVPLELAQILLSCFRLGEKTGFYNDLLAGLKTVTPRLLSELITYANTTDPFQFMHDLIQSQSRRVVQEHDLPFVAEFFGFELDDLRATR